MTIDFHNKIVLVTGATKGIGKQIADDLYKAGAHLLLTGTKPEEINRLNNHAKTNDERRRYFCVDFSNEQSVAAFLQDLEAMPRIDALVNNAGINQLNPIDKIDESDWAGMLAVNLSTPLRLMKLISAKMIQQQYGRIINIGSIFSKISKEQRAAYSATKFGLHGLTVGVSNDLARHKILVNTVSPGFIITELTLKNLSDKERSGLEEIVPAKRLGNVSDISSVVLFLLSDLNQYLTGQNIVVDGGFTNV
jgi:NAD(P)-dependent dehydrogenase (short-subunit alcohol dehydrogenase family)